MSGFARIDMYLHVKQERNEDVMEEGKMLLGDKIYFQK